MRDGRRRHHLTATLSRIEQEILAILSIRNLSKTYPNGGQALDDVTLEIAVGMISLLGPNGAGKSTLMRTVATLQQPDQGSITFGDVDVLK